MIRTSELKTHLAEGMTQQCERNERDFGVKGWAGITKKWRFHIDLRNCDLV